MRFFDRRAADPAAVAPMPSGVRLLPLVSAQVRAFVFWMRLNQGAASRPIAKLFSIDTRGKLGVHRKRAAGHFRAYSPTQRPGHPIGVVTEDEHPAAFAHVRFELGRDGRI